MPRVIKSQHEVVRISDARVLERHCETVSLCCADDPSTPSGAFDCSPDPLFTAPDRLFMTLTIPNPDFSSDYVRFTVSDPTGSGSGYGVGTRFASLDSYSFWRPQTYTLKRCGRADSDTTAAYIISNSKSNFSDSSKSANNSFAAVPGPFLTDSGGSIAGIAFGSMLKPLDFTSILFTPVGSWGLIPPGELAKVLTSERGTINFPCEADLLTAMVGGSALLPLNGNYVEHLVAELSGAGYFLYPQDGDDFLVFYVRPGLGQPTAPPPQLFRHNYYSGQARSFVQAYLKLGCGFSIDLSLFSYVTKLLVDSLNAAYIQADGSTNHFRVNTNLNYTSSYFNLQATSVDVVLLTTDPFYAKLEAHFTDLAGGTPLNGYIELSE